jgi:hypothetical protein
MVRPIKQTGELIMRVMKSKPEPEQKNRPIFRVAFARIIGVDEKGNDVLGSAREIGSIWERKNGKGGILRFDHIPVELSQHQGVVFVTSVEDEEGNGGAQ